MEGRNAVLLADREPDRSPSSGWRWHLAGVQQVAERFIGPVPSAPLVIAMWRQTSAVVIFQSSEEWPLLLLDDEELIGVKQNRILNTTVLVAAHMEVTISVSQAVLPPLR